MGHRTYYSRKKEHQPISIAEYTRIAAIVLLFIVLILIVLI